MASRSLVPLCVALVALSGCGGDPAETKQGALSPATAVEDAEAEARPASPAPAPAPTAPAAATATNDSAGALGGEESQSLGRESFSYTGGSRDPFLSLLSTAKVGPELADLILVAIYYDTRNPVRSVIVMREKIGGKKYSLRPGDRLGRIRLSEIRPKDVVFTIDDFGTLRHVTVSLRKEEKQ